MASSNSLSGLVVIRVTIPSFICARISHLPPQSKVLHVATTVEDSPFIFAMGKLSSTLAYAFRAKNGTVTNAALD